MPEDSVTDAAPERAGIVLSIGKHFDSSQTALDLIAVGYSLGLAASVLYLVAVGDRYGRAG